MKKLVIVLLSIFLVSCIPTPETSEQTQVQCPDGSSAGSIDDCPKEEQKESEQASSEEVKEAEVQKEEPQEQVQPVIEEVTQAPSAPNKPIAQQLIDESQTKFKSYAYRSEEQLVVVIENQARHYFFKLQDLPDRTPITDVYVDLDKKTAIAYCNIDREAKIVGDSFDYDRSKCRDYLNKEIPVDYYTWTPKGPIQYLQDFAPHEPILVEENMQLINIGGSSKTAQPSLHYMVDGKRVVLRIDKRYKIPIKIEFEGEQSVNFEDVFFDTMVVEGKQFKIDDSWVTYSSVAQFWLDKKANE